MKNKGATWIEWLVVFAIFAFLVILLLPVRWDSATKGREGAMISFLHQLATAAKQYESDHGMAPASNEALESRMLSSALMTKGGQKGWPYFEFKPDMLNADGDIVSIIHHGETVKYRLNGGKVELWTRDCDMNEKGCNNWE